MSKNRLDAVETFDQFGHDHWKAIGTKLGGVEVVKAVLRGTSTVKVDIIRHLTVLTFLSVASNTVNPNDFFKTREGLCTLSNFDNFILSGASKKKVAADETTIGYAELVQAANDAEIRDELPNGHVFEDVDAFLVYLATLIEGQWGGKSGTLLKSDAANIFYVKVNDEVVVVLVRWVADDRRWDCCVFRLDGLRWFAGEMMQIHCGC